MFRIGLFIRMVERESDNQLTNIFKAVADPTRRSILAILVQEGPQRVTDLASRFDISLNAVSKHIRVLESAKLVNRKTEWREHLIAADLAVTSAIDDWFRSLRSVWEMRLERLETLIEENTNDD